MIISHNIALSNNMEKWISELSGLNFLNIVWLQSKARSSFSEIKQRELLAPEQ